MEGKKLRNQILLEAVLCIGIAIVTYYIGNIREASYFFIAPLDLLGRGLRALSLSTTVGNILAILIYCVIGALPVVALIVRKIKTGIIERLDYSLVVISGYLLWALYQCINPFLLDQIVPGGVALDSEQHIGKYIVSILLYALIAGYLILKAMKQVNRKHQEGGQLAEHLKKVMIIFGAIYVGYLSYVSTFHLITSIEAAKIGLETTDHITMMGLSSAPGINSDEVVNVSFAIIKSIVDVLPSIMMIVVGVCGIYFLDEFSKNQHSKAIVEKAHILSKFSRITVYVSLLSCIGMNLLQLLFSNQLVNVRFTLDIPILPILLAYVSILLAKYFEESNALYDDQQMII